MPNRRLGDAPSSNQKIDSVTGWRRGDDAQMSNLASRKFSNRRARIVVKPQAPECHQLPCSHTRHGVGEARQLAPPVRLVRMLYRFDIHQTQP
jgi:hypothetical protein